jgi:hypothetical protein
MHAVRWMVVLVALSASALQLAAQQSAASQETSSAATQSHPATPNTAQPLSSEEVLRQEEKQRALGIVPMFSMTSIHNAPPLTTRQKWQLMVKTQLDPFTFVSAGITAGLGQASDAFPQYGQGAEGFGKRYGSALADNMSSNFFSNFAYPVLFKQDPRYFRMGEGPFVNRLFSCVEQEFVSRKDSGGRTFSFSNVLGAITAGTLSNAYYPSQSRGVGLTASRTAIALGYGAAGNLFLEFWTDVDQHVFHKKHNQPIANSR